LARTTHPGDRLYAGFAGTIQAEPLGDLAILHHLGQGDEAEFGIAGGDELQGLGDVLALDELRLRRLRAAQRLQGFDGGERRRARAWDWRWPAC
jgi:hypothetical protein